MRSSRDRSQAGEGRRLLPTPAIVVAGIALSIAIGGSAVAATGMIQTRDIATGAVTSKTIRNGGIEPADLSARAQALFQGGAGTNGANGAAGLPGANGAAGAVGSPGASGSNGANGANGPNGANGANGVDGDDGIDGTDGTDGIDGTDGSDGIDGTIAPLSATKGLTPLPTATPPTTVVELSAPAGSYVVLAKTQLSHTGAGDSVECVLKAGAATLDQVAIKTLPALAAIPVSLQAVTTTASPSQLSLECDVLTANGSANFSSLIAIPTG